MISGVQHESCVRASFSDALQMSDEQPKPTIQPTRFFPIIRGVILTILCFITFTQMQSSSLEVLSQAILTAFAICIYWLLYILVRNRSARSRPNSKKRSALQNLLDYLYLGVMVVVILLYFGIYREDPEMSRLCWFIVMAMFAANSLYDGFSSLSTKSHLT